MKVKRKDAVTMSITQKTFGTFSDKEIPAITLTNKNGISITVIPYGASIVKWNVPDKGGNFSNIVLGFGQLDEYVKHRPYYGATIGRVAGRIANGTFSIEDKSYQLSQNEGDNHLHGGFQGLDTKFWDFETKENENEDKITFSYIDSDGGPDGYPGNLTVEVTYTLTDEDEWKIHYSASTDRDTIFNPTNHVYFNLHGDISRNIVDHKLFVNADTFAELGKDNNPTGQLLFVKDTPFDFRKSALVSQATESNHLQTQKVSGLDHPFVLNHKKESIDAFIYDEQTGRKIEMTTNQPAVVIFLHNGKAEGYTMDSKPIEAYSGITLETQGLPDAINQEDFGNVILRAGDTYNSETVYRFKVDSKTN